MCLDHNFEKQSVGKALLIREGARTIAYGVIVWRADNQTNKDLTSRSDRELILGRLG